MLAKVRVELLGPAVQDVDPVQAWELVGQALGLSEIVDLGEGIVALHEVDAFLEELPGQPLVAIDVDLDGEGAQRITNKVVRRLRCQESQRGGSWASWLPFALPQVWPFCWWLAVVIDHYSRRVMGIAVFMKQPTSSQVRQFLGQVIAKIGAAPKHLVSDHGTQFNCQDFKRWCKRRGIQHRMGAIGKQGSIAVIERLIRTLKDEGIRLLAIVPLAKRALQRELSVFVIWYNESRPHTTLDGATPDEVYYGIRRACRRP
ncbi:MAG: transposase, partial [Gemmataceae bacterium]